MSLRGVVARDVAGRPPPPPEFRAFYHHHPTTVASLLPPDRASRFASFKKCFLSTGGSAKVGICLHANRLRVFKVKASETSGKSRSPIAPLQMESAVGQLLSQIMETHPHLLPATIDQQLEKLQEERNVQGDEKPRALEDVLYRRIVDVREKERKKTVEEIIYCVVVQKFLEKNISMIPVIITTTNPSFPVDSWPDQEHKFVTIHSSDTLEMIRSHLSLTLGERVDGPLTSIVQISKLNIGKLYAASIMYGYFLKRADQRFQLERTMKILPRRPNDDSNQGRINNLKPNPFWDMESLVQIHPNGEEEDASGFGEEVGLRRYIMQLDPETLQRYATIRSKEVISVIEKQTQALFGQPDIKISDDGSVNISNDKTIAVTATGLKMLILESVSLGSFLWGAEGYVESKYHFFSS